MAVGVYTAEDGVDGVEEHLTVHLAGLTPYLFGVVADDECGNAFNLSLGGPVLMLVNVVLVYGHLAVEQLFNLLDHRHHALAVRAPRSIELDKDNAGLPTGLVIRKLF